MSSRNPSGVARTVAPPGRLYRRSDTGGYYWLVQKPGEPKPRARPVCLAGASRAVRSKTHAEARIARLWSEWCQQANPTTNDAPTRTVAAWCERYAAWAATRASKRQVTFNVGVVKAMFAYCRLTKLHDWTREHSERYLLHVAASVSPSTVRAYLSALRRFARFLFTRNNPPLDSNPVEFMSDVLPRLVEHEPVFLDDSQLYRLLKRSADAADLWPEIHVAAYAGLRVGELGKLLWSDLRDTPDGPALLVRNAGRTRKGWRMVPVQPPLAVALSGLRRGEPGDKLLPSAGKSTWLVRRLAKITGDFPPFGGRGAAVGSRWHILRATWAVNCARAGATLWQLMAWGGWRSPQVVMRYINVARAAR